jgi:RHS repeat-associated protein
VSGTTNYAVPSAMTTINLSTTMNWTGALGLSSASGPNGEGASINYDTLARPQSSVSPYGATTTYQYNDPSPPTSGNLPWRQTKTNGHWTKTTLDGFGRTLKTETGDDTNGTNSVVDTTYAPCGCTPIGKMNQTSMPHAPNATVYWKTYTYDGLGRTVSATEADGTSTTTYAYQGNTVQITDPAGKWRKFTMDAFGNLTSVLEPDPLNQPSGTLNTTYAYDMLSHLTTVTMPRATGTQTRTFNYSTGTTVGTLLLSATNPENGTVTYTYNTDKTLATKTDALNQQFSYSYDSYKRVTQINLGQTVIRQFYYDTNPLDSAGTFSQYALGRLTAVQNAPTTNADTFIEMYSYTQPGEITAKRLRMYRTVQSHAFTIDLDAQYSYDNEGRMTSVTYPQSSYIDPNTLQVQPSPVTTYTYGFDTMGRPTSMTGPGVDGWGNPATVNIVNSVQYGPASELLQVSYFGSTETRHYNNRLQMTHLTVPGQLNISYNFATQNNGQISSQPDNLSGEQITYQYDALQRLYSATGSAWSQTFTYDGFGNLTDKVGAGGAPTNHSPVNAATNQLTGYSYDANGNLLTTGYGWDPENRMSYAVWGGTQYAYDSANKRIWTGSYTCPSGFCGPGYGWQFQSETVFFYGVDGKRLAAYTPQVKYSSGTPQSIYYLLGEERVFFGSKYIGNADTTQMSGGTAVAQDRAGSVGKYFPYGDERNNPQLPNDTVKFATYTRDSATGLDYADQRYYANNGRFLSPDPYRATSASVSNPANPLSWNRYSYVLNDPISHNDPTGLDTCRVGAGTENSPYEWVDCSLIQGPPLTNTGQTEGANNKDSDWYDRQLERADELLADTYDRALKALEDPRCSALFKDKNGNLLKDADGNDLDPTQVLKGLYIGYQWGHGAYGTITFSYNAKSLVFATTTGDSAYPKFTLSGPYYKNANIDINMYWFNLGFKNEDLAMLLHELGHAVAKLSPGWGSGNSIENDPFSNAASSLNTKKAYENCILRQSNYENTYLDLSSRMVRAVPGRLRRPRAR